MSDTGDRTIPATPRRREQARRQGLGPTAAVPAWVATVVTTLMLLPAWARSTATAATGLVRHAVTAAINPDFAADPLRAADGHAWWPVVIPTLAVLAAAAAAGVAVWLVLDGGSWTLARAAPQWRRIDPMAGWGRIFSWNTLVSLAGRGLALALLATAACLGARPLVSAVASATPTADAAALFAAARSALLPLLATAVLVTAAEWALARLRFERRLRMTPQEYADEARGMQADPKVRLLRERSAPAPGGHVRGTVVVSDGSPRS